MFTGIVEKLARITSVSRSHGHNAEISIDIGRLAKDTKLGDSICINGVCLTVTGKRKGVVSVDVIEETLRVTNLGQLIKGSKVNVERSLQLTDRIGGHLVTGHIDGTGNITEVENQADGSIEMWIECGAELASTMIPKGSVAVDGISLTLVDVTARGFSICLIPHTRSMTTLGYKKKGDSVNIEPDMLGKYVRKCLEQMKIPNT